MALLPDGRIPVLLSAHSEELVRADAAALLDYLKSGPALPDVAAQLLRTRRIRRHRAVIRAAGTDELTDALHAVAAGADHRLLTRSSVAGAGRLAFVFPGQGTQWPGMGAEAYRDLPRYRAAADECAAAFTAAGAASPLPYLTAESDSTVFSEIEIEGAQFTHAVALARVWQSCCVTADITVGHSLGEVAAAHVAGVVALPDAVSVIAARAAVVDRLPGRYAVAALGITADAAQEILAATGGWVELSVVNGPTSVAVSGDRDAVLAVVETVTARGQFAREITVGFPVHTSILEPLRHELRAQLPATVFGQSATPFIGAAIGDVVAAGTGFADYWYGNLRNMVRFDRAVAAADRCGATSFVELSAHPALHFAITEARAEDPVVLVGSGRRGSAVADQLAGNITAVAVADPAFDWRVLLPGAPKPLRGFPNAPMHATHLWARPEPLPVRPGITVTTQRWQRAALPARRLDDPSVSVAVQGGGALTDRLRAALARQAGTAVVTPADAEILVVIAPEGERHSVASAATELAERVGAGLLDYPSSAGKACRTVCLLTVGGEQVLPGDPLPAPGQAGLAAMHRSVGLDHPDRTFSHLDLDAAAVGLPGYLDSVAHTVLSDTGSGALRVDGSQPVLLRTTFDDGAPGAPWALDDGVLDEVVITGAAGAIGMHYARYLAERGARRIVLLSRRAVDPQVLAALTSRGGTEVVAVQCDITDTGELATAAGRYGGAASLIVHAAGSAVLAPADQLSAADCATTFTAKLTGLQRLTELWPLRPRVRMLLCSSVSGVWGGRGHGAYAAANRMLDVLAAQQRAAGRDCTAIRWGLWQAPADGAGIVTGDAIADIQRSGLHPMDPARAIETSLARHTGDPLVYAADDDRLRIFLQSLQPAPTAGPPVTGGDAGPAQAVRAELAAVLSIGDAASLDLDADLFDLGVDSLLAIDLRKRLKHVTGRTVPLAVLLGGITGTDLVAALARCTATSTESGHPA